jgi:hypothetical protein
VLIERIAWAKQQKDNPTRFETTRNLIEIALKAKTKQQSQRGEN